MTKIYKIFVLVITIVLLLTGCGKKSGAVDPKNLSWDEIVKSAKGSEVNFYMWGGDPRINKWINEFVASNVQKEYSVKINMVPMNAEDFMNKLVNEKQAGKKSGSIDLLWINGENFYAAKSGNMLYGPFANKLQSFNKYLKADAPENSFDFGYPTEGYEVPYGRAQFVFIYDSSKVKNPPKNLRELEDFIKQNPGKFTYPAPPDFTGSAFVRNIMYFTTGGYEQYMKIDENKLSEKTQPVWDFFNRIKPYLWREGKTYPANIGQLDSMFADGEVWMSMTYSPLKPSGDVLKGVFPKDTKTFIIEEGTISNTHFLAIPENAPNKNGAMIVANFLESFEAQVSKLEPANWGDLPVFDTEKLSAEEKKKLEGLDFGKAALGQDVLIKHRVPEIPAKLVPLIEEQWIKNVAREKK